MIINVEGADCTGKSTLVERLNKSLSAGFDVEVLHAGRPTGEDILGQYLLPLKRALDPRSALILDRWHIGELVYGPLRRGESRLSLGQAEYVELVMRSVGFVGILCQRPDEQLISCFDTRGDDDPATRRSQLLTEAKMFRVLLAPRDNWIWYDPFDTDVNDPASVAQEQAFIISRVSGLAPFVRAPVVGAYVGARWPRVLLVGDRRNPTDRHTALPWPFVPWSGTSGRWMFDALATNGVRVADLGVINGQERAPGELRAAWSALGFPPVVALGTNARQALNLAEIEPSHYTHHPQWWRRFKHRQGAVFAAEVAQVMR